VRVVADASVPTDAVTYGGESRLIVVSSTAKDALRLELIWMDKPLITQSIDVAEKSGLGPGAPHILNSEDGATTISLNFSTNDLVSEYRARIFGISVDGLRETQLPAQSVRSQLITGGGGGFQLALDDLYMDQFTDGSIVFFFDRKDVDSGLRLPPAMQYRAGVKPSLYLNNREFMALSTTMLSEGKMIGLSEVTYRIFDKAAAQWRTLTVPGNIKDVRAFGPWMAGRVTELVPRQQQRPSPGRDKRNQEGTLGGFSVDKYFDNESLYRPGILFLYHVPTQRYIEFRTPEHGDSEILLVDGNQVFYRIYDSIYKAPIQQKSIGKPLLLVKNDEVPHIHWIFFGPPLPADFKPPDISRPPENHWNNIMGKGN